jgi:hypothetical protein
LIWSFHEPSCYIIPLWIQHKIFGCYHWFYLFICLFIVYNYYYYYYYLVFWDTVFLYGQAGFELEIPCLYLSSSVITGRCHHVQLLRFLIHTDFWQFKISDFFCLMIILTKSVICQIQVKNFCALKLIIRIIRLILNPDFVIDGSWASSAF